MLWSKVQDVTHTVGGLRQDRPGSSESWTGSRTGFT
jgi:hypothetical protein